MEKIKALLLTLALIFGGVVVFEIGVRYGAANMRAHAVADQLRVPLDLLENPPPFLNGPSRQVLQLIVDNAAATGAVQRQLWYLREKPASKLDEALTRAFSLRGKALLERFEENTFPEAEVDLSGDRGLAEIRRALERAWKELQPDPETEGENGAASSSTPSSSKPSPSP